MPPLATKPVVRKKSDTNRTIKAPRAISDDAVERATGRPCDDWFKALDALAKKLGGHEHKAAAKYLHEQKGVTRWWSQMITVLYERERGHRVKHERPDGFSVSVTRTVAVPIADLYAAWKGWRRTWLEDNFTVRKTIENRSIRIAWNDGTNVEVMFYSKGEAKAQVSVQHSRLKSAAVGTKVKKAWSARLDKLKSLLEG